MGNLVTLATGGGASGLSWDTISGALEKAWTLVDSAITFIAGNDVFVVIFAAGLIPIGFRIFKKAKRAVR